MKTAAHASGVDYPDTTKINMASTFCVGCHHPHTLDADRLCGFCRRTITEVNREFDARIVVLAAIAAIGFAAVVIAALWGVK